MVVFQERKLNSSKGIFMHIQSTMTAKVKDTVNRSRLAVGGVLTIVMAFTPHAIATSTGLISYPSSYPRVGWSALAEWLPVAIGVFAFASALRRYAPGRSRSTLFLIGCLLVLMVKETLLRRAVMSGWVTTAWLYNFLDNLRFAIPIIFCVLVATVTASASRRIRLAAVLATGTSTAFFAQGWTDASVASLIRHIGATGHDAVFPSPYGWQVQLPSYITFTEPVIAAIVMIAIMVPGRMAAGELSRYGGAVAALILIRGKLLLPLTNMVYQKEGAVMGFLAEAQFLVEAVLLTIGAALTWWWATKDGTPADSGAPA